MLVYPAIVDCVGLADLTGKRVALGFEAITELHVVPVRNAFMPGRNIFPPHVRTPSASLSTPTEC